MRKLIALLAVAAVMLLTFALPASAGTRKPIPNGDTAEYGAQCWYNPTGAAFSTDGYRVSTVLYEQQDLATVDNGLPVGVYFGTVRVGVEKTFKGTGYSWRYVTIGYTDDQDAHGNDVPGQWGNRAVHALSLECVPNSTAPRTNRTNPHDETETIERGGVTLFVNHSIPEATDAEILNDDDSSNDQIICDELSIPAGYDLSNGYVCQ